MLKTVAQTAAKKRRRRKNPPAPGVAHPDRATGSSRSSASQAARPPSSSASRLLSSSGSRRPCRAAGCCPACEWAGGGPGAAGDGLGRAAEIVEQPCGARRRSRRAANVSAVAAAAGRRPRFPHQRGSHDEHPPDTDRQSFTHRTRTRFFEGGGTASPSIAASRLTLSCGAVPRGSAPVQGRPHAGITVPGRPAARRCGRRAARPSPPTGRTRGASCAGRSGTLPMAPARAPSRPPWRSGETSRSVLSGWVIA